MKQLTAGVVIILVVGIGGFLYRNIMERNAIPQPGTVACTMDARVCPDGSAVGREGPNCEFSLCAPPNAELRELGIAFVLSEGYVQLATGASSQEMQRIYQKQGAQENAPHVLTIERYQIEEGQTAEHTLLLRLRQQPADVPLESLDALGSVTINDFVYKTFVKERFEGQVESVFLLVRDTDILAFSILERDVANWTDPGLNVWDLPEHQALERLLETLVVY